jgi:hypothetical protein
VIGFRAALSESIAVVVVVVGGGGVVVGVKRLNPSTLLFFFSELVGFFHACVSPLCVL